MVYNAVSTPAYIDYHPNWFVEWCRRKYGPKEPWIDVVFDVIDSQDETVKLTTFTLKFNGTVTSYQVTSENDIKLNVPSESQFTIQILNAEGYVDGVANTYTAALLNGSHIGLTKKKEETDTAEFKLDWDIAIASDLDSHMVIKDLNNQEIGHVFYGNNSFQDNTTSVMLDIDNVSRSDQKPPEIVSINKINPEYAYYYYVHDFSSTGKLPQSNLNLNVVYKNATVDPAITIPTVENQNTHWNVCKIQNGQIVRASDVLTETVTTDPNTSY